MHRRRFIELAATGSSLAIAGCSGGENGESNQTTTTEASGTKEVHGIFEANTTETRDFWKSIAQQFTEETGISVITEFTGGGPSFDKRIATLIQTGNAPEVAQTDFFTASTWANNGISAPMSDVRKDIEDYWGAEFSDADRLVLDGEDYTAPVWVNPAQQAYRADLFEQAGISVPTTWDEELDSLAKLEEVLSDGVSVTNYSADPGLMGEILLEDNMNLNDAYSFEHDGDDRSSGWSVVLDEGDNYQRVLDALNHSRKLLDYSSAPDAGPGDMIRQYYTGKCAIGYYTGARPLRQAMVNNLEKVGNHSRVMRRPVNSSAESPKILGVTEGLSVCTESEYPDAGKEFVKFAVKGSRYIELILKTAPLHNLPVLGPVFEDPEFRDAEWMEKHNVSDEIFEYYKDEVLPNRRQLGAWGEPAQGMQPFASQSFGARVKGNALRSVVIDDVSPENAIKTAASEYRSLLEEEGYAG